MNWLKKAWQKLITTSTTPTEPAPSMFSADAHRAAGDRERDYEMAMAKAKEQARRSAM
jgi:hypothetical protein